METLTLIVVLAAAAAFVVFEGVALYRRTFKK